MTTEHPITPCGELHAGTAGAIRDAELTAAYAEGRKDEREEAEADAKRYQWLYNNCFDRPGVTQLHVWLHTWEPHSQTREPTEWQCRVRGPALDRAIDAAMNSGQQGRMQVAGASGSDDPKGMQGDAS